MLMGFAWFAKALFDWQLILIVVFLLVGVFVYTVCWDCCLADAWFVVVCSELVLVDFLF